MTTHFHTHHYFSSIPPGSSLGLDLPLRTPPNNRRNEAELIKIIDKSGMIKINDQLYKTTLVEMQDLGELGSGTSGHVVKMRHNPSGAVIAVKVRFYLVGGGCFGLNI